MSAPTATEPPTLTVAAQRLDNQASLRQKRRPSGPLASLSLYLLRLLILGAGISAIAGTVLTVVKPTGVLSKASSPPQPNSPASPPKADPQPVLLPAVSSPLVKEKLPLKEELPLKKKLAAIAAKYPKVQPQAFFVDTATKMIEISDNTATNMLIKRLGGKAALNQQCQQWGLRATAFKNALPDLEGTNTTSPKDLAQLLQKVNQGEILSLKSRDRLLSIMEQTKTRTLLPQGLEAGAAIAHKTGDIGTVLGDAGIIDMPSGKRYIGSVLAKRSYNDPQARELIQQMSRAAYQHFKWYRPRPLVGN